MKSKVLVAMSGGVDSSAAAALLSDKGYECIGVTMKLYDNEDVGVSREKTCCSLSDTEDARSVAAELGMRYYVLNFKDYFKSAVCDKFISVYENGLTPNPCIDCNKYLKFDGLYKKAEMLECDYIVTGHYARIEKDSQSGRYKLKKAVNKNKDQSYVLYFLTQEQLKHTLFPLGEFDDKSQVRSFAEKHDLVNSQKHESQDICFVPDGDYAAFIKRTTGKDYPCGKFVDESGKILGEHKGIIRYTIGQRKGLGLALPEPMYVKEKNAENNTVTLAVKKDMKIKSLIAKDFNWLSCPEPRKAIKVNVKTRYRAREVPAVAEALPDGSVLITFDEPSEPAAPGQAAVLYDGEYVIGGGTIVKTL